MQFLSIEQMKKVTAFPQDPRVGQWQPSRWLYFAVVSLNAEEAGRFMSSLPHELKPKMITFKESEKEWRRGHICALHLLRNDRDPHSSKPEGTFCHHSSTSVLTLKAFRVSEA